MWQSHSWGRYPLCLRFVSGAATVPGRVSLDAVAPLTDPEQDEAALPVFSTLANAEFESEVESISLGSDDDELDCGPYAIPLAAKPSVTDDTSRCGSPNPTATDLHDVCRRAAKKLGIEWPETLTETTTSRYEGKRLPRAKSSSRQLLPVFPRVPRGSNPVLEQFSHRQEPRPGRVGAGLDGHGGRRFFTSASCRTSASISPAPITEVSHDSGRTHPSLQS
ncbi:hypothetical protein XENOCAPTIV_000116 [Xenoophorus captivus]|uniref:Uncharacterized protein n=1 Tax=Xenoophorus captivus TaxID=1517983 RepID=A0ABV0S4P0_9TELE